MEISGMSVSARSVQPQARSGSRSSGRGSSRASRGGGSRNGHRRSGSGSSTGSGGAGGSVFAVAGRNAVSGRAVSSSGRRRVPRTSSGSGGAQRPSLGAAGPTQSRYKLTPEANAEYMREQEAKQHAGAGPEVNAAPVVKAPRKKPTGVKRAKVWSPEVENCFRMQEMGWRDIEEYRATFGEPDYWDNGLYSKIQSKQNGYYTYWKRDRECLDKYLHRVKIFSYN